MVRVSWVERNRNICTQPGIQLLSSGSDTVPAAWRRPRCTGSGLPPQGIHLFPVHASISGAEAVLSNIGGFGFVMLPRGMLLLLVVVVVVMMVGGYLTVYHAARATW